MSGNDDVTVVVGGRAALPPPTVAVAVAAASCSVQPYITLLTVNSVKKFDHQSYEHGITITTSL